MEQVLRDFPKQFSFQPLIENAEGWRPQNKFLLLGMGGSHLAGDLLKITHPHVDLLIHSDYGLPTSSSALEDRLIIASSYSGNTEEVIEGAEQALAHHLPLAVIAVGGKLLELAIDKKLPYVQLPDTGIQPRAALGFSMRALLALLGDRVALEQTALLVNNLQPTSAEEQGKKFAHVLKEKISVIYASTKNQGLAYNWKIKLNETGKIPAFYNVIPELNHNEMNGFDGGETTTTLRSHFHFIFITDSEDHPQIQKRFQVLRQLLLARNYAVSELPLQGSNPYERIFSSLLLADWCAVETAKLQGCDPEPVPIIQEFKVKIAE